MPTAARTALITGANRGLGRETASQLAARGFNVIVTSRKAADARAAADALGAQAAPESIVALPLPFDVADAAGIAAAADHLRSIGAVVDVLVNNAGIAMDGFNADVARRTIEVNFFGP